MDENTTGKRQAAQSSLELLLVGLGMSPASANTAALSKEVSDRLTFTEAGTPAFDLDAIGTAIVANAPLPPVGAGSIFDTIRAEARQRATKHRTPTAAERLNMLPLRQP